MATHSSNYSVYAAIKNPSRLRIEIFAGLVTAFALIPECTSFAIAAGVGPEVGLFSAAVFAMVIAFTGGRVAMASGAAGSVALVLAPLVHDYGMDYLIVAVVVGGLLQIMCGIIGVAQLMRYIPQSVMGGFVNGLAILIFLAQLPHMIHVSIEVYVLIIIGLIIMVVLPKITTIIPAPLITIVVLTLCAVVCHWQVPCVKDEGAMPDGWPHLLIPHVPWSWHTLTIVFPSAIAMALVGLLESLMTAALVDDITDTPSNKQREAIGQGIANLFAAVWGGIAGCGMIGQTIINVKIAGARTRISTFLSGFFVIILVVPLSKIVAIIPMAALVAVMIIVSISTFSWRSISFHHLRVMPLPETIIMLVTVIVTVVTKNLAYGVIVGVIVACIVFARNAEQLCTVIVQQDNSEEEVKKYSVEGNVFFASSHDLVEQFDYTNDPHTVIVDMSHAHVWDASSIAVMDAVQEKYHRRGKDVVFIGLNSPSRKLHQALTTREEVLSEV